MAVDDTLKERGNRYGDFTDHARIAQELQDVMHSAANPFGNGIKSREWERLSPVQKQALTVIADKIARILSGDPNYIDNWHDIQGYARLVEERLEPGFDFANRIANASDEVKIAIADTLAGKSGQVKLVKPCCKHANPNPQQEGLVAPWTYCLNCGHRYKPGEIQDVGS